jgi:hypothetical protein
MSPAGFLTLVDHAARRQGVVGTGLNWLVKIWSAGAMLVIPISSDMESDISIWANGDFSIRRLQASTSLVGVMGFYGMSAVVESRPSADVENAMFIA